MAKIWLNSYGLPILLQICCHSSPVYLFHESIYTVIGHSLLLSFY